MRSGDRVCVLGFTSETGWRAPRWLSKRWPEVLGRGTTLPTPDAVDPDDALALLIYTSGSTGAPKGALHRQSNVAKTWRRSKKAWFEPSAASITLNFMPMSHVVGRGILYRTLGNGGTAYFGARSDRSTFLEDLALVRPTELNFVPRIREMLYQEYRSRRAATMRTRNESSSRRGNQTQPATVIVKYITDLQLLGLL